MNPKYANDGHFLRELNFLHQKNDIADGSSSSSHYNYEGNEHLESKFVSSESEGCSIRKQVFSARRLRC